MTDQVRETQHYEPPEPGPTERAEPVPIEAIRTDGGTQTRSVLDGPTIDEYATRMEMGATFPPGIVYYDGQTYWLAAGFHRLEAAKSLDAPTFDAVVRQGTVREAILCALGQNERHGLRRTAADRRRAVTRMLEDPEWQGWGNAMIARVCDVDAHLVAELRTELLPAAPETSQGNTGMRLAQRGATTYPIRPANQWTAPSTPAPAQRPVGIREPDVKPKWVQIRGTLDSICRAMQALPSPDQAAVADPEFDMDVAAAHARWWQAFAAHLKRKAERAS